jgi:hypothetical protein
VAPLRVNTSGAVAAEHPEWILKKAGRRGEEVGQLDYTLPAVRDYVYSIFRRFYDWGYRYFRTDLGGCEIDPHGFRYRGGGVSVQDSLRSALMAIRAGIGEESFWVAADAPLNAGAGLWDAVAVAQNARPYFSSLLSSARSSMFRAYMHGLLWLNDPGLLLARGPDTVAPEGLRPGDNAGGAYERYGWEKGRMLNLTEARVWTTWIIMSGGILTFGDRLASLNEAGIAIVKKAVLRSGNIPATPLDLGVVPLPRIWQRLEGRMVLMALFNWSEEESEIVVTERHGALLPSKGEIFEVWKDESLAHTGEVLKRRLPPHSCELLEWDLV